MTQKRISTFFFILTESCGLRHNAFLPADDADFRRFENLKSWPLDTGTGEKYLASNHERNLTYAFYPVVYIIAYTRHPFFCSGKTGCYTFSRLLKSIRQVF
jgi:hypothetical protein